MSDDLIRDAVDWATALEHRADDLAQKTSDKAMGVLEDRRQARMLRRLIARAKAWEAVAHGTDPQDGRPGTLPPDSSAAWETARRLVAEADRENEG